MDLFCLFFIEVLPKGRKVGIPFLGILPHIRADFDGNTPYLGTNITRDCHEKIDPTCSL